VSALSATKDEWRSTLIAARRAVPPEIRTAEAVAIAGFVADLVHAGQTACCYVPVGTEPGSPDMLDDLMAAGVRVLLPVVTGAHPLEWTAYDGSLRPGPHRLLEPAGPRLGPAAVGTASLVLVPALAVDSAGVRLGRGAGHYDRSLLFAAPEAALVAVVRDEELVGRLPSDPHDVRMTAALTPGAGLIDIAGR
jgi:5-formyltetrahydrofolate cyclo-ligase